MCYHSLIMSQILHMSSLSNPHPHPCLEAAMHTFNGAPSTGFTTTWGTFLIKMSEIVRKRDGVLEEHVWWSKILVWKICVKSTCSQDSIYSILWYSLVLYVASIANQAGRIWISIVSEPFKRNQPQHAIARSASGPGKEGLWHGAKLGKTWCWHSTRDQGRSTISSPVACLPSVVVTGKKSNSACQLIGSSSQTW